MSRTAVLTIAALLQLPMTLHASDQVRFTHGVASGDVTHSSAIIWTRVDEETAIKLEISVDESFGATIFHRTVQVSASDDYTAKVFVSPLVPATTYFYRWRRGNTRSDTGTFRTAPAPSASSNLRFAFSGDSDGTRVGSVPAFNNFEVLDAIRAENADFFVYLGDTIYADSVKRALGPAATLDEYREAYKVNREIPALPDLLRTTPIFALWDDHEFRDDGAGPSLDPTLYANGRQAFLDYMPVADSTIVDATCAGNPRFRVVRWGHDVDLIFLDERSCRSPEARTACEFAPGHPDLAPTLPGFLRSLPGFAPFFPVAPAAACLSTIADPSRTLLGPVQKARFKSALRDSTARFKFVVNEVEIGQSYVFPYDRWEGYASERAEILRFIRDEQIANVIFLTTDTHQNVVRRVFVDRFSDPAPVADEFVTGPIAYYTWAQIVSDSVGGGAAGAAAVSAVESILTLVGTECRNLNTYSYATVQVDAASGTVTIALKDQHGIVVRDDVNPGTSCIKTISGW